MMDQPELDLPHPVAPPSRRRTVFAGFTGVQLGAGLLLVVAIIWAMWVTHTMLVPEPDRLVSARLSEIVGEYVQAEARSPAPPAQVEAEMRRFMASLDRELQRRSSSGQVVLVGEAVLTRNVPDITDALRSAVYASGVRRPLPTPRAVAPAPPDVTPPAPSPFVGPPPASEEAGDGLARR